MKVQKKIQKDTCAYWWQTNFFGGCVFVCVHTHSKQMQEQTQVVGSLYLLLELTLKAKFRKQKHHINHKNKSYN